MIGTIQDITDRKKTEKALQNIQKLESLSLLAGGIAHDFNNLLGGIYGYIDMAIELAEDPILRSYLSKAMSTMDRGKNLTRQLITFSKGGVPVLAKEHLYPFLKETAQFALSGSNVSVICEQPEGLWPCNFDKNQISQVVDNIIINAKQAMPNGGTIEIEAKNMIISDNDHPVLNRENTSVFQSEIMESECLKRFFPTYLTRFLQQNQADTALGLPCVSQ